MPLDRQDAFLALNLLPRLGPVRVRRLLEQFSGEPERALIASGSELRKVDGIGAELAATIQDWENQIDLEEEKKRIKDHEISLLTIDSESYPKALRKIYDPPFLLYVRGEILPRDQHAIAIVGSRRVTHYGSEAARRFGFQLAHAGITVISGLARGIDTAGHESALAAGGRTLAVLGSGIGNIYPAENKGLADRISENGAVISEFPVLYTPDKQSFPLRNRIVSGMSRGVLVVEAPERSGSMITANQAMEQGRTVFAVPGPIDRPTSLGCHRLIQQGAKLATDASDILAEIKAFTELDLEAADVSKTEPRPHLEALDANERVVFQAFAENSELGLDEIVASTNLPLPIANVALLQLEMKSLIKTLPGGRFGRKGS